MAQAAKPLWGMLGALIAGAALSQAFRTAATVMAGPLQAELGLSAEALGVFSGAYHLSFAALQLVMGVALDVYGPRRTVTVAFALAILGALLSAFAPTYTALVAGQLLIGAGCAPTFLAAMVFVANRYAVERFTRLSGLVLALSGVGMLITASPLAWVVEVWSWRAGFLALAAGAAIAWLCTVLLVSAPPRPPDQGRETLVGAFREVGAILAQKHTLGIIVLGAVTYAAFITLRGLWVVPLLVERHDYTLLQSGHVVLALSLATLLGPPIFGRLDPGGAARRFWIIGFTIGYALLFVLLASGAPASFDVGAAVASGVLAGYIVLQYADVRTAYARKVMGRAFATFNTVVFLGVALMQWGSGVARSIDAAFVGIALVLAAGAVAFFLLPWPPGLRRT